MSHSLFGAEKSGDLLQTAGPRGGMKRRTGGGGGGGGSTVVGRSAEDAAENWG